MKPLTRKMILREHTVSRITAVMVVKNNELLSLRTSDNFRGPASELPLDLLHDRQDKRCQQREHKYTNCLAELLHKCCEAGDSFENFVNFLHNIVMPFQEWHNIPFHTFATVGDSPWLGFFLLGLVLQFCGLGAEVFGAANVQLLEEVPYDTALATVLFGLLPR